MSGNDYYKIGTIVIKTHKGDIFYTPSNNYIESPITLEKKEFEHISWHVSGQVHIKRLIEKNEIIQKANERQGLSEMGFKEMLVDTIKDFTMLPIYQKKVIPLDIAQKYQAAPLHKSRYLITIAMTDPMDINALDTIEVFTNTEVEAVICTDQQLNHLVGSLYGTYSGIGGILEEN